MIPTRTAIKGDRGRANFYRGFAKKLMHDLETDMQFNEKRNTGYFTHHCSDGTIIQGWSNFGTRQIIITVPTGGEVIEEEGCYCNSCFTVGRVIRIDNSTQETGSRIACSQEYSACDDNFHGTSRETYTVELCRNRDSWIIVEGCRVLDHATYCPDEFVALMRYPFDADGFELFSICITTCPSANCGVIAPEGIAYVIAPFTVNSLFLNTQ